MENLDKKLEEKVKLMAKGVANFVTMAEKCHSDGKSVDKAVGEIMEGDEDSLALMMVYNDLINSVKHTDNISVKLSKLKFIILVQEELADLVTSYNYKSIVLQTLLILTT